MNQEAHSSNWIDAWLETQRGWLGRWQSTAVEQRVDALRVAMDTLRAHLNPAEVSPEALNVVQSFQTLVQSCMANAGEMAQMVAGDGASTNAWQQLIQVFPLGPGRELQVAWQAYLRALAEYQLRMQSVLHAYAQVFAQALEAVPGVVEQRAAQGQAVSGFRELYELWIECGEQVFARLAHDEAFIAAQAASTNALSRLKRSQQVLIEYWLKSHDLPTRSELNSVHLRLRELSARVVDLEQQLAATKPSRKTRGKVQP